MASHYPNNVISLHRAVAVRRDPDDIVRQHGCEAQAFDDLRERLTGPARHVVVSETASDTFRDIIAEVRGSPFSHAAVALASFIGACVVIYGGAWVLVEVLA